MPAPGQMEYDPVLPGRFQRPDTPRIGVFGELEFPTFERAGLYGILDSGAFEDVEGRIWCGFPDSRPSSLPELDMKSFLSLVLGLDEFLCIGRLSSSVICSFSLPATSANADDTGVATCL